MSEAADLQSEQTDRRKGSVSKLPSFSLVAACCLDGGMGYQGKLPWPTIKEDLQHFKEITTKVSKPGMTNAVILGRNTWDSLPKKPLPKRLNIVLTKTPKEMLTRYGEGLTREQREKLLKDIIFIDSLPAALRLTRALISIENIFVIGGAEVFKEAIQMPECKKVYLTMVNQLYPADVFFPIWALQEKFGWCQKCKHHGNSFSFHEYIHEDIEKVEQREISGIIEAEQDEKRSQKEQKEVKDDPWRVSSVEELEREFPESKVDWNVPKQNYEEYQYLHLVREIIDYGVTRDDRTGVGTKAVFGRQMRFDLSKHFPLLTTKKVFWKGVVEELLWFIRGSTNSNELSAKGVKIWDEHGSREFLDKCGFKNRKQGDLGQIYGWQWRHFGAKYIDCDTDYTGQGVDQLADVIHQIKTNPNSRRIVMSAWNPSDLKEMVLPPCHMFCQFFVAEGKLSCQMYQRSADVGLGVAFNIASYSLLTCMIAQICGLQPGEFVHVLGDTHIYLNHIAGLKEQLTREPYPFPKLELNPDIKNIERFTIDDIKVVNYQHHPTIKLPMAV